MFKLFKNEFKITKTLLCLIISCIAGYGLLCGAYVLPQAKMKANVFELSDEYGKLTPFYRAFNNSEATTIDTTTDSMILLEAVYDGPETLLEKAVLVKRQNVDNDSDYVNIVSIYALANDVDTEYNDIEYYRYWHGYLTVIKPLLMFLNSEEIFSLNKWFLGALMAVLAFLMFKKGLGRFIIPLLIAAYAVIPEVIVQVFNYSNVMYVLLLTSIGLLAFYEKLQAKRWFNYYFLIIGILTSYFDLLTVPLITLAIPLVIWYLKDDDFDLKGRFFDMALLSISWCLGYLGFWMLKLVTGSLIMGRDLISPGLEQVAFRMTARFTALDAITKNLDMLPKRRVFYGGIVFVLQLLVTYFINHEHFSAKHALKHCLLLVVTIAPFLWYGVVASHSAVHYWMTYRLLAVSLFAVLSYLLCLMRAE